MRGGRAYNDAWLLMALKEGGTPLSSRLQDAHLFYLIGFHGTRKGCFYHGRSSFIDVIPRIQTFPFSASWQDNVRDADFKVDGWNWLNWLNCLYILAHTVLAFLRFLAMSATIA